MRRRALLSCILATVVSRRTFGQQGRKIIVGFLGSRTLADTGYLVAPFVEGLAEFGLFPGRNLDITYRWADGDYDRLDALAAELVTLNVDVLFAAGGPPAAVAAKRATSRIPIVFSAASDPVKLGLVSSLSRPGANITGMSTLTIPLVAKGLELLKDLLPNEPAYGILVNPTNPSGEIVANSARSAAAAMGMALQIGEASSTEKIDSAFSQFAEGKVAGVVVAAEPFFDSNRAFIVTTAARYALPAIYGWREYVELGGLASYGTSLGDSYREAGRYVGRIVRGEKPADLPVMQPSRFEFVVNLSTARALGLSIAPAIAARADDTIE